MNTQSYVEQVETAIAPLSNGNPCQGNSHDYGLAHGPYYKWMRELGSLRKDIDDDHMYFVFVCSRCGNALEVMVNRVSAPERI